MKQGTNKLSKGFIQQAANDCGVTRVVFYNAKKNYDAGRPLSKDQVKILARYKALLKQAKADLEFIKEE